MGVFDARIQFATEFGCGLRAKRLRRVVGWHSPAGAGGLDADCRCRRLRSVLAEYADHDNGLGMTA